MQEGRLKVLEPEIHNLATNQAQATPTTRLIVSGHFSILVLLVPQDLHTQICEHVPSVISQRPSAGLK